MEFLLAAAAVGSAIYLGYDSMAPQEARRVLEEYPEPIYENSSWYGQGSDAVRFNPDKAPVEAYIGQFGIPQLLIKDGYGCLTSLTDIGIGTCAW